MFNKLNITYVPTGAKVGPITFFSSNLIASEAMADLVKIHRNSKPDRYFRRFVVGNEEREYAISKPLSNRKGVVALETRWAT